MSEPSDWAVNIGYEVGDYINATYTGGSNKNYRCNTIHTSDATLFDTDFDLGYWDLSFLEQSSNNHLNYSREFVLPSSNIIRTWEMLPVGIKYTVVSDGYATEPKNLLLTNHSEVTIGHVYPFTGTPPDYFNEAFSYALAAKVALGVTENRNTKADMIAEYISAFRVAKNIDSQGKRTTAIMDSPFLNVR